MRKKCSKQAFSPFRKWKFLTGFTLIELLVVIIIIGILASIALPNYFKAIEKTRILEAFVKLSSIHKSQMRYLFENDEYADDWDQLDIKFNSTDQYFDFECLFNSPIPTPYNGVDQKLALATRNSNAAANSGPFEAPYDIYVNESGVIWSDDEGVSGYILIVRQDPGGVIVVGEEGGEPD